MFQVLEAWTQSSTVGGGETLKEGDRLGGGVLLLKGDVGL